MRARPRASPGAASSTSRTPRTWTSSRSSRASSEVHSEAVRQRDIEALRIPRVVMPGLVPGIHVYLTKKKLVDGRDKPGHDDEGEKASPKRAVTHGAKRHPVL